MQRLRFSEVECVEHVTHMIHIRIREVTIMNMWTSSAAGLLFGFTFVVLGTQTFYLQALLVGLPILLACGAESMSSADAAPGLSVARRRA